MCGVPAEVIVTKRNYLSFFLQQLSAQEISAEKLTHGRCRESAGGPDGSLKPIDHFKAQSIGLI
jgi:hypothetical protein